MRLFKPDAVPGSAAKVIFYSSPSVLKLINFRLTGSQFFLPSYNRENKKNLKRAGGENRSSFSASGRSTRLVLGPSTMN